MRSYEQECHDQYFGRMSVIPAASLAVRAFHSLDVTPLIVDLGGEIDMTLGCRNGNAYNDYCGSWGAPTSVMHRSVSCEASPRHKSKEVLTFAIQRDLLRSTLGAKVCSRSDAI